MSVTIHSHTTHPCIGIGFLGFALCLLVGSGAAAHTHKKVRSRLIKSIIYRLPPAGTQPSRLLMHRFQTVCREEREGGLHSFLHMVLFALCVPVWLRVVVGREKYWSNKFSPPTRRNQSEDARSILSLVCFRSSRRNGWCGNQKGGVAFFVGMVILLNPCCVLKSTFTTKPPGCRVLVRFPSSSLYAFFTHHPLCRFPFVREWHCSVPTTGGINPPFPSPFAFYSLPHFPRCGYGVIRSYRNVINHSFTLVWREQTRRRWWWWWYPFCCSPCPFYFSSLFLQNV